MEQQANIAYSTIKEVHSTSLIEQQLTKSNILQLNQTINLIEDRHCLPSNDKEARKLYNASYYATNREKILKKHLCVKNYN